MLSRDHPGIGYPALALGSFFNTMDEPERFLPYVARAAAIWEASLGSENPQVVLVLEDHADLLRRLGYEQEAGRVESRIEAARAEGQSELRCVPSRKRFSESKRAKISRVIPVLNLFNIKGL